VKKPYILMKGDCVRRLKSIPDNKIDLTLTSPPYDDLRTYGKNKWDINLSKLGEGLHRVTKDGGICAVVISDATHKRVKTLTSFKLVVDWCENRGWKLWETLLYRRPGIFSNQHSDRFRVDHEYIFLFLKGDKPNYVYKKHLLVPAVYGGQRLRAGKRRSADGKMKGIIKRFEVAKMTCPGTVWDVITSNREDEKESLKFQHPATFGKKFARDVILCFTRKGDIVLDPMVGSGTTCQQALENKRHAVGIEINPKYYKIAKHYMDEAMPIFNQTEI